VNIKEKGKMSNCYIFKRKKNKKNRKNTEKKRKKEKEKGLGIVLRGE
jgi:hypothetical protein